MVRILWMDESQLGYIVPQRLTELTRASTEKYILVVTMIATPTHDEQSV